MHKRERERKNNDNVSVGGQEKQLWEFETKNIWSSKTVVKASLNFSFILLVTRLISSSNLRPPAHNASTTMD